VRLHRLTQAFGVTGVAMLDDTTLKIAKAASELGPFLFATLYILFVPRIAHKWWHDASEDNERRTLRIYFISSVGVGIILMSISIAWWIYSNTQKQYFYQWTVTGLKEGEHIASNYYSRISPHPTIPGATLVYDQLFLFVSNTPIEIGQKFTLDYGVQLGTGLEIQQLDFAYGGNREDQFKVAVISGKPKLELVEAQRNQRSLAVREATPIAQQLVASVNAPIPGGVSR
jgi:hypothetical protein